MSNSKNVLTPDEQKKKRNKRLLILIFIAVNVLVIGITAINEFGNKNPSQFSFELKPLGALFIAIGFACLFLSLFLETFKYLLMMKGLGVKISFKTAFQTAVFGKYFDNITPSGVGGQPFQIYNMHKAGYSDGASAAMPLTQFFTMQTGFIILSVFLFIFRHSAIAGAPLLTLAYIGILFYLAMPLLIIIFTISRSAGLGLIGGLVKLGAFFKIVKNPEETLASVTKSMDDYRDSMKLISKNKFVLPLTLLLSVAYQLCLFSIPFFVLMAFNGNSNYFDIITMVAFVYCSSTIIPTPGNAGAAEGSFYIVFSSLDSAGLFWSMLIWRFISYYTVIIIGALTYGALAIENHVKARRNS